MKTKTPLEEAEELAVEMTGKLVHEAVSASEEFIERLTAFNESRITLQQLIYSEQATDYREKLREVLESLESLESVDDTFDLDEFD